MKIADRFFLNSQLSTALSEGKEPVIIGDIAADSRFDGFPDVYPPVKSFLSVPIIYGNTVLGLIYLARDNNKREFLEMDANIIQSLAAHAAASLSASSERRPTSGIDTQSGRLFSS